MIGNFPKLFRGVLYYFYDCKNKTKDHYKVLQILFVLPLVSEIHISTAYFLFQKFYCPDDSEVANKCWSYLFLEEATM